MNHLEETIREWLEWQGYFVRSNVNVAPLARGGHSGELDIVALHPETRRLLHVECSNDAHDWETREKRFTKKFSIGKAAITREVFPWLRKNSRIEQWAVIWGSNSRRKTVGGGTILPVRTLYEKIVKDIRKFEAKHKYNSVIPEKFPLLRTIQFTVRWIADSK